MVWSHTTAVWCKVKLCVEEVGSHVYTNLTGINSYAGDYKHLELFLMVDWYIKTQPQKRSVN